MTDEDRAPGTMTPALPSRATGETKPLAPLPATEPARKASARKPRRLPAKEIKRINTNRRKNLKKSKVKKAVKPVAPRNPNRPLEAKNRLHATLAAVAALSKQEGTAFAAMMSHLEDMAGPARRRVIEALGKVYA